ncbi:LacI family DNA-binding transcriptional regulator [Actinomyces urinae]|uniref:LacI family DNA-binding transcriptional regulator n=1 Tax=Actinomyces urinae TaxID=1689268 RepID=UPI000931BCD0|nr:LacI family DNA-binding transcriptional regulator [Actinomyces urinae]
MASPKKNNSQKVARPTMKDVAALAGVGIKTVSRVVNGEPHVSEETIATVEQAIAQLNFRRNEAAANLRQGQSSMVGLVVENLSEPIQASIASAVERVALEEDYLLVTASSSDNPDRERKAIQALISRRVDGLIIIPSPVDHGYLQFEIDAGMAVVFVDRSPLGLLTDVVLSDNRAGAFDATQHLIKRGHRRIAYIGDSVDMYASNERVQGYRDALASEGIAFDDRLVHLGHPSTERAEAALQTCIALDEPATALITGNSLNTISTLHAPTYVTAKLDHVAFDDLELADLLSNPLSVVAQDPTLIGTIAAQRLFARIKGTETGEPQTTYLPTRLIIRS